MLQRVRYIENEFAGSKSEVFVITDLLSTNVEITKTDSTNRERGLTHFYEGKWALMIRWFIIVYDLTVYLGLYMYTILVVPIL